MFLEQKSRKRIASADEVATILGIHASNIRHWARSGELKQIVESPRRVYYYLDEVERLNKKKSETRKKRGGRPRKGTTAA